MKRLFKETRETHGILTPGSMVSTLVTKYLPPETRQKCNPMP
jgi:hypothetical protein